PTATCDNGLPGRWPASSPTWRLSWPRWSRRATTTPCKPSYRSSSVLAQCKTSFTLLRLRLRTASLSRFSCRCYWQLGKPWSQPEIPNQPWRGPRERDGEDISRAVEQHPLSLLFFLESHLPYPAGDRYHPKHRTS